jgi:hypothetical protein
VAAIATGSIRVGSRVGKAWHVRHCLERNTAVGLYDLFAAIGRIMRSMAVEAAVFGSMSMRISLYQRGMALDAKFIMFL